MFFKNIAIIACYFCICTQNIIIKRYFGSVHGQKRDKKMKEFSSLSKKLMKLKLIWTQSSTVVPCSYLFNTRDFHCSSYSCFHGITDRINAQAVNYYLVYSVDVRRNFCIFYLFFKCRAEFLISCGLHEFVIRK